LRARSAAKTGLRQAISRSPGKSRGADLGQVRWSNRQSCGLRGTGRAPVTPRSWSCGMTRPGWSRSGAVLCQLCRYRCGPVRRSVPWLPKGQGSDGLPRGSPATVGMPGGSGSLGGQRLSSSGTRAAQGSSGT